jgi:AcrR family transcriptional regulator
MALEPMADPAAFEPLTPDRRRRQTRDHLLDAAAQVLSERGYHGASLDEVAAKAGFTKGAVYSNFKNKEDLFLALLDSMREREMEALHQTIEASDIPPASRLEDFVAFMRESPSMPTGWSWIALYLEFCLYAMRNPAARERLVELQEASIESIAEVIETERSKSRIHTHESPRQLARIVEAFTRGLSIMRELDPEAVDDAFLEVAISVLARALNPQRQDDEVGPPPTV